MKKFLISFVICAVLISCVFSASALKFSTKVSDNLGVDMSQTYEKDEHTMIPLRSVAENLGYEVIWNDSEKSVTVSNDNVSTKIFIGKDSYFIEELKEHQPTGLEMANPVGVGVAPELRDGKTYVPAVMMNMLGFYNNMVQNLG